jgi:hypothetical protein
MPIDSFLHWRLSDDGPGASRIVPIGRHPKPFTTPVISANEKESRQAAAERPFWPTLPSFWLMFARPV